MIGIGIGIIPRTSVTSVSVVTATVATGIGITSFTANWNAFSGAQYYLLDVSTSSSFDTFVYQDQVVLAPTTAYVVIGLTENTTYYYRVRASTDVYIDPDYIGFFSRVVAAGGFLTIAEQDATRQLITDLKANNLWIAMKAIYPMVGSSAASCAQNLKSANFTGTFTPGWTFSSTGATPNGTSAYMDTFLVPSTSLSLNSASIGFYGGTNLGTFLDKRALGAWSTSPSGILGIEPTYTGYGLFGDVNDGSATFTTNTNSSGFIFATRTSATSKIHSIRGTQTTKTENSTRLPSVAIILGAFRVDAAINNYSAFQHRLSFIGEGLSATQSANFYNVVQKFNQSLNRQVGAQLVSDPDAQAYIDRVYTAGGTLTNTEATAVNQLTIDLKSNGTWSSMKAIYPMIGASAAACAQNLRSSSFTGTFTATGWTFASTGVSGNGTSAFMDTAYIQNNDTSVSTDNFHHSVYINNGVVGNCIQGCYTAAGGETDILPSYGGQLYAMINNTGSLSVANTTRIGHFIGSRYQLNSIQYYLSASQLLTTTSTPAASKNNLNYYIGLLNDNGTPTFGNASRIALSTLGQGLSPTQASDLYTSVQKFNQTLDRQVGAQIVSDPDAQSYINRVYTAGGTLTNLEANAVNKLAIDMKAAGLWTSMKAVYPMIGSSAASCAQNLKSSSFTGSFTAGWTFGSSGVTPNGTSAYMDTNITPSNDLQLDSVHLSSYLATTINEAGCQIGVLDVSTNGLYSFWNYSGNGLLVRTNSNSNTFLFTTVPSNAGFRLTTRTASNLSKVYVANTSSYSSSAVSNALPTSKIFISARALTNTTASDFSAIKNSFASIGDGLDDTQSSNFYTLVQSFNQTLGRSVGSQIVSDADAQAYVNRVYNAGGSLTNTEANAVNQLVLDMKTAGIWTSMKAVYPMVGSSAAACAQNLKSSSFTGTFSPGWTFASTGVKPDGFSAYMNTTLLSNDFNDNKGGYTCYTRDLDPDTGTRIQYGSNNTSWVLSWMNIKAFSLNVDGSYKTFSTLPDGYLGSVINQRIDNSNVKINYRGGNQTVPSNIGSTSGTNTVYLGAWGTGGGGQYFSPREIAFFAKHNLIDETQSVSLINAVQIFQNTLGRAV